MIDFTSQFYKAVSPLVQGQLSSPLQHAVRFGSSSAQINSTIGRLDKILVQVKSKYLKKRGLSEGQKDKFQSQVLEGLETMAQRISEMQWNLEQSVGEMQAENKTQFSHKKMVLGILTARLKKIQQIFRSLKKSRLIIREEEQKLFDVEIEPMTFSGLVGSQVQDLEVDKKTELQIAAKRIARIQELINHFSQELSIQDHNTELILMNAQQSLRRINNANKGLKQNSQSESYGRKWGRLFLGMAISLIVLDILK